MKMQLKKNDKSHSYEVLRMGSKKAKENKGTANILFSAISNLIILIPRGKE